MEKIFKTLSFEQFMKASTIFMMMGDLALFFYIYIKFSDKAIIDKSLSIVMSQYQEAGASIPNDFAAQIYQLWHNSLIMLLIFAALAHFLIYFFYFKRKRMALSYVKIYSALGMIALALLVFSALSYSFLLALVLVLGAVMYFTTYQGFHYYKKDFKKILE